MNWVYSDTAREGDHICYYSDLRKMKAHFPDWDVRVSLQQIFEEVVGAWQTRAGA